MTGSHQESDNKAGIQLRPSRKDWRESESLFAFLSKYAENGAYSKQIHNNVAKIFKIMCVKNQINSLRESLKPSDCLKIAVFASLKPAVPWTQ